MCEAIWHRKFLLLTFSLSCIKVSLRFTRARQCFKVLIGTCLAQSLCGLWGGLALLGRINQYGIGAKVFGLCNIVKMKILSFNHPHVVPKMYDFLLWNRKEDVWKNILAVFVYTMQVKRVQNNIRPHWLSLYGQKIQYFSKYLLLWSIEESHAS